MKDVFNTVIFIMKEEKCMKKKILSAALFSALVSSALGVVTAGAVYEIDEVTVTADREGNVAVLPGGLVNQTAKLGILGNKSVMDIPYSEMSMTEKHWKRSVIRPSRWPMCSRIILLSVPALRLPCIRIFPCAESI